MTLRALPNISGTGRRRRRILGIVAGIVAVVALGLVWWRQPSMPVRALVFVPAFVSALGLLQARRATCVAVAFSGKRAVDCELAPVMAEAGRASRAVAWTIVRDALLVGFIAAVLAMVPGPR